MPAQDELDLLARCRPAALDQASQIMDETEKERVLGLILDSDPAPSLVSERARQRDDDMAGRVVARSKAMPDHRRRRVGVGAIAAAVLAVAAVAGAALAAAPGAPKPPSKAATKVVTPTRTTSLRWQLVGDVTGPWHPIGTVTPSPSYEIYCSSATTCYALGSDVNGLEHGQLLVTNDGGHSWSSIDLSVQLGLNTVMSCADADTCAILGTETSGDAVFLETTGGQDWTTQPGPSQLNSDGDFGPSVSSISGLACTSASSCIAVADSPGGSNGPSNAFATTNGGVTWSESSVPVTVEARAGVNSSAVECPGNGSCFVTGFAPSSRGEALAVAYSTDGGASWQQASVPAGTQGVTAESCPQPTDCLMVSFGGGTGKSTILQSSDGGASWNVVSSSGLPQAQLTGISCSSSDECWTSGGTTQASFPAGSIGSLLAVSTDQGETWQQAILPPGVQAIEGVSCPSGNTCYALGLVKEQPGDMSLVLLSNTSKP
jgi:photosystem II stability/assembly factor-like uncharacterized protein